MSNKQQSEILDKTLQFVAFTQYSDTANYIHHQLKKRGIQHIDKATDGSKNPTATGSMGLKNYEI